jgi:cephalosporin-C deacetylase
MPVFDMSMAELQVYRGSDQRPDDLNGYWEQALGELGSVQPDIKLSRRSSPVAFAELYDLYFTGVRGARIHAQYLRPREGGEPHPAVLMFHGYSGDSGDWSDKLGYVAQGYSVAALDCRGQGGSSQDVGGVTGYTLQGLLMRGLDDDPQDLLFRHIFLDCVQLAGIVMSFPEINPSRLGVLGASQGGGLALACAALEPRISRVASVVPFFCDFRRAWEIDVGELPTELGYQELKGYFRRFDPTHQRESAIFDRLGYIDLKNLSERIRASVLWTTSLLDTTCPPSTQFAAFNRISTPKEMRIYPDFGHEAIPGVNDANFEFMCGL